MCRRICFIIILFICIGLTNSIYSQESRKHNIHLADSILQARGEVSFSFNQDSLVSELSHILSLDHLRNGKVIAYANTQSFQQFIKFNISFSLLPENFTRNRLKSATIALDSLYPTYPRYLSIMQQFHEKYPSLCTTLDIGESVRGRKIRMVHISGPTPNSGPKPAVLLTSSMHGDELTGFNLMLRLIDYLLANYQKADLVTRLINGTDIWINPLANPDGTYYGGDNTVTEATRYNANAIDLNRNYPDPADGDHPDNNDWQPENLVMMKFYKEKSIKFSVNFHTGTEVVNYPWDTWSRSHPDASWYQHISRQYADSARKISNNAYLNTNDPGFDRGIVDGYVWYRVTGGRQDYFNYFLHGREVTIELSQEGLPDSSTLSHYWEYNRTSLLRYMEQSLFGIQGIVTDSLSGVPLKAKVEVRNHDADNTFIYSDSTNGAYYRYLYGGTYTLLFTADGYRDHTITNIVVNNEKMTPLSVKMFKPAIKTGIFPNPFTTQITFEIDRSKISDTEFEVSFYNVVGRKVFSKIIALGSNSMVKIPLPDLSKGVYLVKVSGPTYHQTYKIMKL
jgi:hypothetical protein